MGPQYGSPATYWKNRKFLNFDHSDRLVGFTNTFFFFQVFYGITDFNEIEPGCLIIEIKI